MWLYTTLANSRSPDNRVDYLRSKIDHVAGKPIFRTVVTVTQVRSCRYVVSFPKLVPLPCSERLLPVIYGARSRQACEPARALIGPGSLIWPHCDGLSWPDLSSVSGGVTV